MIVTCPNCQTRYNLPDDKVPAGGAKVKCSKCAHVFKSDPPPTPEEEVETLLEEETPAPDTGADEEFDETFDEVAAGADAPADEPADEPADDPVPEEEPAADESSDLDDLFADADADNDVAEADDDMAGVDDLFDDSDETPDSEEGASPSGGLDEATADDVESLFGDDEDDLFSDDDDSDAADDADDLFADDDGDDADDLFADDDDEEEEEDDDEDDDDEEYEDDEDVDFGLDDNGDEPRKKGGKSLGCLIIILVLALAIGGAAYFKVWTMFGVDLGSYFQNVPYIGKMFMEETGGSDEAAPGESPADRVRKIELKNVKQYYVANEKTGNLFVVEGKAVNKFATPKEQIKVEVVLYDGTGNILKTQSFLCGNVLSQFQLQVQTQKEIEDGLSSEVGILSNNTFIRPGASTPFMAVFFEPPAGVKEFLVKVVDVGDPE